MAKHGVALQSLTRVGVDGANRSSNAKDSRFNKRDTLRLLSGLPGLSESIVSNVNARVPPTSTGFQRKGGGRALPLASHPFISLFLRSDVGTT
jgi:hypothetical protein